MITDTEYRALKRAVLLRETRTVEFEGRKVLFLEKNSASFSEMERRLQAIERELIKSQKRPKQFGVYSSKGI